VLRRAFLERTGRVLAAAAVAPILDACTRSTPSPSAPSITPDTSPSPPPTSSAPRPTWASLEARLKGSLIRPGSAAYPSARLEFDPRFDTIRPRGIVMAENANDVATSIAFARDRGMPFTARCGGHSYGGYSVCDGLVIDVAPMAAVVPRTNGGAGTA
jgi:hypothetical protein